MLAIVSQEPQDSLGTGHRCSCIVRNQKRSKRWMHRLLRLDDRYPSLFCRWLTGSVDRYGHGPLMIVRANCPSCTGVLLHGLVMQELVYCQRTSSITRETDLLQVCLAVASLSRCTCKVFVVSERAKGDPWETFWNSSKKSWG